MKKLFEQQLTVLCFNQQGVARFPFPKVSIPAIKLCDGLARGPCGRLRPGGPEAVLNRVAGRKPESGLVCRSTEAAVNRPRRMASGSVGFATQERRLGGRSGAVMVGNITADVITRPGSNPSFLEALWLWRRGLGTAPVKIMFKFSSMN
jgi:hypothetical protein